MLEKLSNITSNGKFILILKNNTNRNEVDIDNLRRIATIDTEKQKLVLFKKFDETKENKTCVEIINVDGINWIESNKALINSNNEILLISTKQRYDTIGMYGFCPVCPTMLSYW